MSIRMIRLLLAVACGAVVAASVNAQEAAADRVEGVLRLSADTVHGRALYAQNCAGCHGVTARGDAAAGYPALAGQRPNYLVKQLAEVIESDRSIPEMHRLMARWQFDDPQSLRDIVTWLGDLAPDPAPQTGNGSLAADGARVYQSECASCHGRFGEGADPAYVPALRGQHYSYLKKQMTSLAQGHRNGMDGEGRERLARISLSQLDGIADYLSRLPSERDAIPDGNPFGPAAR